MRRPRASWAPRPPRRPRSPRPRHRRSRRWTRRAPRRRRLPRPLRCRPSDSSSPSASPSASFALCEGLATCGARRARPSWRGTPPAAATRIFCSRHDRLDLLDASLERGEDLVAREARRELVVFLVDEVGCDLVLLEQVRQLFVTQLGEVSPGVPGTAAPALSAWPCTDLLLGLDTEASESYGSPLAGDRYANREAAQESTHEIGWRQEPAKEIALRPASPRGLLIVETTSSLCSTRQGT